MALQGQRVGAAKEMGLANPALEQVNPLLRRLTVEAGVRQDQRHIIRLPVVVDGANRPQR
jgi:hypothetical protein